MNFGAVRAGFKQMAVQFLVDPQWIVPSILTPFLFTMVMLYIYPDVTGPVVLQAVLGGGVLGMWANTLFASSFSIAYDRTAGTFESIIGSPTNIYDVLLGRSIWNAFIGLLNALLIFVLAELIFQTGISVVNPLGFFTMLVLTLFSLASIGMLISTAFVLTRAGRFVSSIVEYPIYVLSGALVPISVLPVGLQYVSYILAPAWGIDAMKYTALEGYESMMGTSLLFDIVMMILLSGICLGIAHAIMDGIQKRIRTTGSIARY